MLHAGLYVPPAHNNPMHSAARSSWDDGLPPPRPVMHRRKRARTPVQWGQPRTFQPAWSRTTDTHYTHEDIWQIVGPRTPSVGRPWMALGSRRIIGTPVCLQQPEVGQVPTKVPTRQPETKHTCTPMRRVQLSSWDEGFGAPNRDYKFDTPSRRPPGRTTQGATHLTVLNKTSQEALALKDAPWHSAGLVPLYPFATAQAPAPAPPGLRPPSYATCPARADGPEDGSKGASLQHGDGILSGSTWVFA